MKSFAPDNDSSWLQARSRVQADIFALIRSISTKYVVRGSFCHGDFHLLPDERTSFSDLDLLYPNCRDPERFDRAAQIGELLEAEIRFRVRVSVQPADMYVTLSPSDSRFLSIGEYFRHQAEYWTDEARSSYLLAKTTLATLRLTASERYGTTASRLATPAANLAFQVKQGKTTTFDQEQATELLRSGPREALEFLAIVDAHEPLKEAKGLYVRELSRRGDIPVWLRALVVGLVESSSDAPAVGRG